MKTTANEFWDKVIGPYATPETIAASEGMADMHVSEIRRYVSDAEREAEKQGAEMSDTADAFEMTFESLVRAAKSLRQA
jgi:DNA-binding PucR family transcriptional regulator